MYKLYLKLLLARRIKFEDVPENYQDEVKNLLVEKVNGGDSKAKILFEEIFER